MAEIKGFSYREVANSKKNDVLILYAHSNNIKDKMNETENTLAELRRDYVGSLATYRMKSVDRVLEYIRGAKITDKHELDTLLCHCQNKLNGNIDGIEFDLGGGGND